MPTILATLLAAALAQSPTAPRLPTAARNAVPTSAAGWLSRANTQLIQGRTRQAITALQRGLTAFPNDSELLPLQGVACAQIGDFPAAVAATDGEVLDSKVLRQARTARAAALRQTGRPADAAALRAEGLVRARISPTQEAILWSAISGDRLLAGDRQGAWDAAHAALAANPELPAGYVALANMALDMGDIEEAEVQLMLASRYAPYPRMEAHLRGRLILDIEPDDDAFRQLFTLAKSFRGGRLDPELTAMLAEGRRRQGDPGAARSLLERDALKINDELFHPALLAMRALVAADLGEHAAAADAIDRALRTYPNHQWVTAAVRALETK